MKLNILSLGLFSLSTLLPLTPAITSQANAACVMVDTNTQVAIHGSQKPASQSNNVEMQSAEDCFGNVTVSNGTQSSITPGEVQQSRNSTHYVGGGTENSHGLSGPTIRVPVSTQVDAYSPAHDPNVINFGE